MSNSKSESFVFSTPKSLSSEARAQKRRNSYDSAANLIKSLNIKEKSSNFTQLAVKR
ncbi:hypothetical protein [Bacillus sp. JJ722]|uniref:hypothetical protein n=1 Tax=Bacillus sp. JJ722 TaxID=3122973 RepID=UPI002FFE97CF